MSANSHLEQVVLQNVSAQIIKWGDTSQKTRRDVEGLLLKFANDLVKFNLVPISQIFVCKFDDYGKRPADVVYSRKEELPNTFSFRLRTDGRRGVRISVTFAQSVDESAVIEAVRSYNEPPPKPKSDACGSEIGYAGEPIPGGEALPDADVPQIPTDPISNLKEGNSDSGAVSDGDLRAFYQLLWDEHGSRKPIRLETAIISLRMRELLRRTSHGQVANFFRCYVSPFAMKVKDEEAWSFDWSAVRNFVDGGKKPSKPMEEVRLRVQFLPSREMPAAPADLGAYLRHLVVRTEQAKRIPELESELGNKIAAQKALESKILALQTELEGLKESEETLRHQIATAALTKEEEEAYQAFRQLAEALPKG